MRPEDRDDPPAPVDLRLVPAALAAWATVLLTLQTGWGAAAVLGSAGALAAGHGVRRGSGAPIAVGGVLAAVALAVGAQAWRAEHSPVRESADRGAAATLEVELRGDPRPVAVPGYGGRPGGAERVVVRAELRGAVVAGETWRGGGRVVVLGPADGWAGLLPGQRVRVEGLLAPPDRADLTVAVLRARGSPEVLGTPDPAQRAAERVRAGLRGAAGVLDPEPAGLLPALVVGDTAGLAPGVRADFQAAGMTHLTAVSGANVAIVCGAVLGAARLARAGPRTSAVLAGVVLVGFVVVCRPSPSVLRAAVMGGVALLALVLGRTRSAVPALAAAVIGLLLADPELGGDPGFALSVLATGGLVLLAPPWAAALQRHRVPRAAAEALVVPAAAHVVTAPVVAALSGEVSLVAVLANLLAAPAVAPATVLGVLAAVLALVHPGTAELVVHVAGPAVSWLVVVGHRAAAVPDGVLAWPSGARGGVLLAVLLLGCLLALRARRVRVLALAAAAGVLLVVVPTRVVTPGWPAAGWAVVACDVGQGDAIVLATGTPGRAVLVDAGAEPAPVAACLARLGVTQLALVVLSHLHADHVGGLAGTLDGRSTAAVAVGPGRSPPEALARVQRTAAAAGAPVVALAAGQRVEWPGLALDVLGPVRPPPVVDAAGAEQDGTAINDTSLVLRATTPAGRVLLTGDVELAAQADLLASGADLAAEVLKVPHHGSRATAPEFLTAVGARVALVSVGAGNSYGHPSPPVVDALTGAGTRVLRTDQDGDLAVTATPGGPAGVARGDPRAPP